MTSETEARRSVAMTGAPLSALTPLIVAVSPCSWMSAPSRASSCTCMKRFSKIVSRMTLVPAAVRHQRHELRLQVGREAGERLRFDAIPARCRRRCARCGCRRWSSATVTPVFGQRVERRLEIVGPGAFKRHVAAGRGDGHREGAGLDAVGEHGMHRAFEPVAPLNAQRSDVPMPSILAPILMRQSATSPISGSRAAFSMTVSPLASAAANRTLCVAPTETFGKHDAAAAQAFRRARKDVAAFDIDLGAERLQAHQMQIDRAACRWRSRRAATPWPAACARGAGQAPRSWRASARPFRRAPSVSTMSRAVR